MGKLITPTHVCGTTWGALLFMTMPSRTNVAPDPMRSSVAVRNWLCQSNFFRACSASFHDVILCSLCLFHDGGPPSMLPETMTPWCLRHSSSCTARYRWWAAPSSAEREYPGNLATSAVQLVIDPPKKCCLGYVYILYIHIIIYCIYNKRN